MVLFIVVQLVCAFERLVYVWLCQGCLLSQQRVSGGVFSGKEYIPLSIRYSQTVFNGKARIYDYNIDHRKTTQGWEQTFTFRAKRDLRWLLPYIRKDSQKIDAISVLPATLGMRQNYEIFSYSVVKNAVGKPFSVFDCLILQKRIWDWSILGFNTS